MTDTFHGQQLKAARVLAALTIAQLADAAVVTIRTVHRLEIGGVINVSSGRREGHVSLSVWSRIVDTLFAAGVELHQPTEQRGPGVSWRKSMTP